MFRETVDDAHLTNNDLPSSIRMITFGVDDRQLEANTDQAQFSFFVSFFLRTTRVMFVMRIVGRHLLICD